MPTINPPWPPEIVDKARAMWVGGVPRPEIVDRLQDNAHSFGRVITLDTLNGFALRLKWGPHPTSRTHYRIPRQPRTQRTA